MNLILTYSCPEYQPYDDRRKRKRPTLLVSHLFSQLRAIYGWRELGQNRQQHR
jgi:hypothetical protein